MDTSDENQGIFLIAKEGTEYRIAVCVTNTDSNLIFQIPELNAGNYELQVRCIAKNTKKAYHCGLRQNSYRKTVDRKLINSVFILRTTLLFHPSFPLH